MRLTKGLHGYAVLRLGSGLEIRLHNLLTAIAMALLVVIGGVVLLTMGSTDSTFSDLVDLLRGSAMSEDLSFAIADVRMPRILMGFMAGWCVALTGAMLQSLAQNPLADPGLLGLSQGSLVAIMLVLVLFPGLPLIYTPLAGFVGGLAVAVLLMVLVGRHHSGGLGILLMGIAVETTLSSVTSVLILYAPPEQSHAIASWLAGSLFHSDWPAVGGFSVWFFFSIPAVLVVGRKLRSLDLGDHMALALGEPVHVTKPIILIIAVLLSAAATAAVGPLVFLGVMAPHLAGFISPAKGRARLLLSAMMGGVLVVAADGLTRLGPDQVALPTGLAIMMIGAPLFIISLRIRTMRQARS
ncbi:MULTISPECIES: FecCD family ABC transporter permease [Thalassospira]|uniref:ABC transporter permease n=2 Tax=Thalassospira TaxID=168934 RepID=A0A367W0M2_9PROT|nr:MULTISPECIES: iron ABC transporter permease [Thalassospira]MDG4721355.1 iron ABC transporter permease [Thalassospira sp. FZY0004]RCK32909.1 ABC transporter permease [Thalassospira profundimaris]